MDHTCIKKNKGFTLLEAIIAIAILLVAIAGPMSISHKSLQTSLISKDEMTATFLAEDAIEAVRTIRDQYKMQNSTSTDWLNPLNKCVCTTVGECNLDVLLSAKFCNLDTTIDDMTDVSKNAIRGHIPSESLTINGNMNPLEEVYTSGLFEKYDLGIVASYKKSKFSRYFNLKKISTSDTFTNDAVLWVKVTWNSPLGVQQVNIKHNIYSY